MTYASRSALLRVAVDLAAGGVPVLPLSAGKRPVPNCPACAGPTPGACGGRPTMLAAGPCCCPAPCHGWAAATTDPAVLTSRAWARAWQTAGAVAYHPGGAGLTVVDLDNPAAVAWARATLPPTRRVSTSRGEHWIYRGATRSANAVRPGVDIKSAMAYARWLGPGTGTMTVLPPAVPELARKEEPAPGGSDGAGSPAFRAAWNRSVATGCRHTERYVRTGLARGLAMVRARTEQGAGSQAFGVARFLAAQHRDCPGPCDLAGMGGDIVRAAVAVGVPAAYAVRAVERGFATAGVQAEVL
ncbi:bifunctional DNA primase/polymerase [Streptomyces sp. DSM 44917]|uniref:Bifunctional DNA primase/polymerase n=1 Tax=Streptomyces boetiae TaxID=3075541 RepID=A0ABU2L6J9_9ACTN|nr:bifunctional DNA primase/polymerase [Streptomyces sp. DSM 44917]MDT0307190.1 bifunctional DNA primase/polymerase [Streptomyces sp. DSM 44917]